MKYKAVPFFNPRISAVVWEIVKRKYWWNKWKPHGGNFGKKEDAENHILLNKGLRTKYL